MTPTTRQALGLPALPADQAARIEAQARDLASGRYMRWPEATALLPDLPDLTLLPAGLQRTPLIEAVELDPDSGWAQWDLAVRLGDRA
ncbi:MAG: hypothetical protein IPM06_20405 [Rhizobiales bacterium]|nr:hypothetical protein [Hyphomicrobiales bacterium]